jgi:hypothetical protein
MTESGTWPTSLWVSLCRLRRAKAVIPTRPAGPARMPKVLPVPRWICFQTALAVPSDAGRLTIEAICSMPALTASEH